MIELLIAMIISAIVIACSSQVYLLGSKMFGDYRKECDKTAQVVVLNGLLHSDFFESLSVIRKSENSIEAVLGNKTVNYRWNNSFVVRTVAGVRDTFFIPVTSAELAFQDKTQDQSGELIDRLLIVSEESDQEQYFCFFKEYSADVQMQHSNPTDR